MADFVELFSPWKNIPLGTRLFRFQLVLNLFDVEIQYDYTNDLGSGRSLYSDLTWLIFMQIYVRFFSRVHATLHPALSVGRLVGRSVGHTLLFLWFLFFYLTAPAQMV